MNQPAIAFISLWFPKPSETFVFREIMRFREMGLPLKCYSLYGPLRKHLSPEMAAYSPEVEHMGIPHLRRTIVPIVRCLMRWPRETRKTILSMPITKWGNWERTLENMWAFHCGFHLALRMVRDNIVHIHSPWASGPCTAAQVASRLTGIPFSFAARAGDIYPPEKALTLKARDASFVRVNYAGNQPYLREHAADNPDKVKLVYNSLTLTSHEQARVAMRPPFRFTAMGRFVRTKGFDVLLTACDLLRKQGMDFTLDMVGDGPWKGKLVRQARELGLTDRVAFPGYLSHERISEILERTDVSVTPSVVDPTGDRDGIPNVIMEAMSYGLPVVATDVAGIREVVHHRETGLLVPQRDPEALADAMRAMTDRPEEARSMGASGRELVLSLFDYTRNCARLMDLFRKHSTAPAKELD